MGCSVRELLRRVDSHELAEWSEYYRITDAEQAERSAPRGLGGQRRVNRRGLGPPR